MNELEGTDPSICVVTHPLSSAGESATRSLLDVLSAITSVSLLTSDLPRESSIWDQYEVVVFNRSGVGNSIPVAAARFVLNQLRMMWAIVRRDEPIILFFGATAYIGPIVVAKLSGRTVVVEPRGNVPLTLRLTWERRLPAPLARRLAGVVWALERLGFHVADAIVVYTPGMAESLDLESFSTKLHPHGGRFVDLDRFEPTVPFERRERVVGFLGRLDEEKGIRHLAAAVKLLPSDIRIRFIGDGPLRPWIERYLETEIDSGSVRVTGWVDHADVPAELTELRLLVLPSRSTEGLPMTILESLACGTPVYATPVSGVPDVIRDGETGYLIDAVEPESIADGIQRILSDPALSHVGTNGRNVVERTFSFERAVDRYRTILRSIVEP